MNLLRDIVPIYSCRVYAAAIRILALLLLTHLLGAAGVGEIKTADAIVLACLPLLMLGTDNAVLKFLSENRSAAYHAKLISNSALVSVGTAFVWCLLCFVLTHRLAIFSPPIQSLLRIVIWALPSLAFNDIAFSFLHSQRQFRMIAVLQSTLATVEAAALFVAVSLGGPQGWALAKLLVTLVSSSILMYLIRHTLRPKLDFALLKSIFPFSACDWLTTISAGLCAALPLLIADWNGLPKPHVGVYAVAAGVIGGARFAPEAIIAVATPSLSEHSRQHHRLLTVIRPTLVQVIAVCLLTVVPLMLLAPHLMHIFFPHEDALGIHLLRTLAVAFVFDMIALVCTTTFMATGNTAATALLYAAHLAYSSLLLLIFSHRSGFNGIVLSQCIASATLAVLSCSFLLRHLSRSPIAADVGG